MAKTKEQALPIAQEFYTFFVKTDENVHTGGFTFFSKDEFEASVDQLHKEAQHIASANGETLKSWGITDSSGKVVEEFE